MPLPVSDCAVLLQQETTGALQKHEEEVVHYLQHLFQGRSRGIIGRSRLCLISSIVFVAVNISRILTLKFDIH